MKTFALVLLTALFVSAFAQNEVAFVVKKKTEAPTAELKKTISAEAPRFAPPVLQAPPQMAFFALGFQLRSGDSVSAKAIDIDKPFFAATFTGQRDFSVNSFKMAITIDGKSETLSSNSNYFTNQMKKKLAQLKAGSMVVLKEIKYAAVNSSPDDTYAGPFKLFIKE